MTATMRRTYFWPRLSLFMVIGIGAAVVWGCLAAFIVEGLFGIGPQGRVAESIVVLSDGEPLIAGTTYGAIVEKLPERTLDRRPATRGDRTSAPAVRFNRHWLDNRLLESTTGYAFRVLELGDNRLDAQGDAGVARWYAVRDGNQEGRAYVVGYDVKSKLPLGYLGRGGFMNSQPDPADQFVVGDLSRRSATLAVARGENGPVVAFAYLLDGDRLVEVDTLGRAVREVAELSDALALDVGFRTRTTESDEEDDRNSTRTERVLVVWQGDRLSVVDQTTGDVKPFGLPDEVRDAESFGIHLVGPDATVVEHYPIRDDYHTVQLLWTTAAGNVTRKETVKLNGYLRPDERVEMAQAAVIVPVPLMLGTLIALGAPHSPLHHGKSFGQALADVLAATWPPLVMLIVVSAGLAWWVRAVHRRDGRRYAALWATLVFLLGPAAWLAYVAERRRTPVAACPACGAGSPRNRVDCAACGEDAFKPRPLGTEVFA